MAEKIKAELLSFLKGSELPLSILVVESVGYLPALRRLFPRAALYAVTANGQPESPEYADLSVHWTALDYLAAPLPFAPETFDYIISDLLLEQAGNPQDIAAGFSRYIKQTGALLTSFRNIRHWSVLEEIRDGHYYRVCARLFAKPEFEKLLYASYYKAVRMRAQRLPLAPQLPELLAERLRSAGLARSRIAVEGGHAALTAAARLLPEATLRPSTAEARSLRWQKHL